MNHLKSTALPERHVVLGFSSHSPRVIESKKALLRVDLTGVQSFAGEDIVSDNEMGTQSSSHNTLGNSSDFLNTMRHTFDNAKNIWKMKVGRLKQFMRGSPKTDEYQSVFDGILLLYTGHGNTAVKGLEELYSKYPGYSLYYKKL